MKYHYCEEESDLGIFYSKNTDSYVVLSRKHNKSIPTRFEYIDEARESVCGQFHRFQIYFRDLSPTAAKKGLADLKYGMRKIDFLNALLHRFDECCKHCYKHIRKAVLLDGMDLPKDHPPTEDQIAFLMLRIVGENK